MQSHAKIFCHILTCAGTDTHDAIESNALLNIFSEVSQEVFPVDFNLSKYIMK